MNKFQVSSKSASVPNSTVVVVFQQVKGCKAAFIPVQTNIMNLITRFMGTITEEKARKLPITAQLL